MSAHEYQPGEKIPTTQYQFVQQIGAGGFGCVFVVEHEFLQRKYVMKLLHAHLVDRDDLAKRMVLEARTLAKIDHPNVVRVHDGGITTEATPRPYFVMDLLRGQTLAELLREYRRTGLGFKPALVLIADLLDGLHVAHAKHGVIHRDLKPANIFLHRTPAGRYEPKILDFGIQHLLRGTRMTGEQFLGSLRYSAPEQIRGERPTPQTDLYAIGLVFYELVCGRGPFDERKGADVAEAHLRWEPPPLSSFVQNVPEELERMMPSWLAKEPSKRPPSADLLAIKLREVHLRMETRYKPGATNDTDPDPLHPFTEESSGEGNLEVVTSPQAPGAKKASEAGCGTTERDAVPMGGARTAVLPKAPDRLADRATASGQPLDRAAQTPTMPGAPPPPRQGTDTASLPPLGAVEDNVFVAFDEPNGVPAGPLPAAGTPPPGGVSRSASGVAASLERRPSRRFDGLFVSLIGLILVGGALSSVAIWAVSRPRVATESTPPPVTSEAPTTTTLTSAPAPVEKTSQGAPDAGAPASMAASALAASAPGPSLALPAQPPPKPRARRNTMVNEL